MIFFFHSLYLYDLMDFLPPPPILKLGVNLALHSLRPNLGATNDHQLDSHQVLFYCMHGNGVCHGMLQPDLLR